MAASLTSSGVTFSTGNSLSDAPWYTGSTATNTSFPIGSYIMTGSTNYCGSTGGYNLNNSKAVWVASGGAYGHQILFVDLLFLILRIYSNELHKKEKYGNNINKFRHTI